MSHLLKIYALCKFSYFIELTLKAPETKTAEYAKSVILDEAALSDAPRVDLYCLPSSL